MSRMGRTAIGDAGFWLALWCACGNALAAAGAPLPAQQAGWASVYSDRLNGKRTANGERYDSNGFTAAHMTVPLGSELKVTNLANRKSVRVRVNDRGPHVPGRIIDLSSGAAAALGLRGGTARVKLEVLSQPADAAQKPRPRG